MLPAFLVNYVTGRQQITKVKVEWWLFFPGKIIFQKTIQTFLCLYAPLFCMNTWMYLGMMFIVCLSICMCELKYIGSFIKLANEGRRVLISNNYFMLYMLDRLETLIWNAGQFCFLCCYWAMIIWLIVLNDFS